MILSRFCIALALCLLTSQVNAADPTQELLGRFVGKWRVRGTAAGMPLQGNIEVKMAIEGVCTTSEYSATMGNNSIRARHILGWNPADKSIHAVGYFSFGMVEDFTIKAASDKQATGSYKVADQLGTKTGEVTFTFRPDGFAMKTTDLLRDGETSPGLDAVFTKISE